MTTDPHPLFGYLALNACTVIWGTQHAVTKSLVGVTDLPMLIISLRFSTAAIITLAVRWVLAIARPATAAARTGRCGLLIGAAELAFWQTGGFALQPLQDR